MEMTFIKKDYHFIKNDYQKKQKEKCLFVADILDILTA